MKAKGSRDSLWAKAFFPALTGLAFLIVGGLTAGWASLMYFGGGLDETGQPQLADSWWMAFVLWGGVAVMIGGPLLCWIVIPVTRWILPPYRDRTAHER